MSLLVSSKSKQTDSPKLCKTPNGVLHTFGEACLVIGHEELFGVATEIRLDHTPSF